MEEKRAPIPYVDSSLRHILRVPKECYDCSGIVVNGRRVKSLLFSTDIALIRNCDADAVFAVYPFTPQQAISNALINASYVPVFCGRTVTQARDVEAQGAMGVVLNAPISDLNLLAVSRAVDIPVIITVANDRTDIAARLKAGANILNVAAGAKTPDVVAKIRAGFPDVPIIASGGNQPEAIRRTVQAGANAITYTPPSTKELFSEMMAKYREM